jgi:hypothetical protein
MTYDPKLFVHHQRKQNLNSVANTYYKSGYFRIKSQFLYPQSFNFLYILPLLLSVLIFTIPIVKFLLIFYLFLILAESLYHSVKYLNYRDFLKLFSIKVLILASYILGNISCLFQTFLGKVKQLIRKLSGIKKEHGDPFIQ